MINKDFTLYPEAFELKQLGFDEPCFGIHYYKESYPMLNPQSGETELVFEFGQYIKQTEVATLAPTYSQAFRWLKENYELDSEIHMNHEYGVKFYTYLVFKLEKLIVSHKSGYAVKQNTYKEAELACLREMIKIIKEKQK